MIYSDMIDFKKWDSLFEAFISQGEVDDPAHDVEHIKRVVRNVLEIHKHEGGKLEVIIPSAWLHDCVVVPKDSPKRSLASKLAAEAAVTFLRKNHYPEEFLDAIEHAITAHSFSAGLPTRSLEACIVQDADRLDAIGAVGLSRCLMLGGKLERVFYDSADPFCEERSPRDDVFTLDHFYAKLLGLAETMKTKTGKVLALERTQFIQAYLDQLKKEIS
jgi:uncharacterized protein